MGPPGLEAPCKSSVFLLLGGQIGVRHESACGPVRTPYRASHRGALALAEAFEPPVPVGLAAHDFASPAVGAVSVGVAVAIGDSPQTEARGAAHDRHFFGLRPCPPLRDNHAPRRLTLHPFKAQVLRGERIFQSGGTKPDIERWHAWRHCRRSIGAMAFWTRRFYGVVRDAPETQKPQQRRQLGLL